MSRFRIPGVRRSACLWLATALAMLLAAPAKALGLAEAVRQGLAFHLAVAAARAELAAARTETGIARDGYWPTVQAAAGPENALWGELGYEVTASLMLYDWGRVRSRVERASAVERQRLHALKAAAEQAALDIVEAYLDVLLFEARVAAVERHIGRVVELAAHGGERVARGYADRGEAERAVLELARAREQRAVELGALLDARAQFRELVGQEPQGLDWPQKGGVTAGLRTPQALEAAVSEAPFLLQAQAAVDVAQAERAEARAALRPQLRLEGSLLRREIGRRMEEDAVIALRLRLDAFQGLSSLRRVDAASRRIEAAGFNVQDARRALRRELLSWTEQAEVLDWRLQTLTEQLAAAREVAAAYREQFEIGMRSIDDLLPVQRELFEAERLRADLESSRIRVEFRAASRLGRLGELLGPTGGSSDGGVDG